MALAPARYFSGLLELFGDMQVRGISSVSEVEPRLPLHRIARTM